MNEKKILEVKKDGVYSYSIYLEPDFQGLKEALLPLQTEKKKALYCHRYERFSAVCRSVKRCIRELLQRSDRLFLSCW